MEDSDDHELTTQNEAQLVIRDNFLETFLRKEIARIASGTVKVSALLRMWIHRRKYNKFLNATLRIQAAYRRHRARTEKRLDRLNEDRLKRIKIYLRHF